MGNALQNLSLQYKYLNPMIDNLVKVGYNYNKIMSIKALSDYTFYSRYSQYLPNEKRRETWEEAVERVFKMHRIKYEKQIQQNPELLKLIDFAEDQQKKKRVLAAQRTLQFAIDPIFKHELKTYNCLTTHVNRGRVFQEMMYALLCGCGVGFSVQKQHINQLGVINRLTNEVKPYIIEDSIEGWADAVGVLIDSYFRKTDDGSYHGMNIDFDFSKIRPEGSLIAGRFKAPGPNGLKSSLENIKKVIENRINSKNFTTDEYKLKLRPIDAYDIVMHISDAVLSGGVRRSATLCLFSFDDDEMMKAKTGDWFNKNPQRARSNNSAALLKGKVTEKQFSELMQSTKEFGEPGFIWVDDLEIVFNPCCLSEDSIIMTDKGPRKVSDLIGTKFVALVNGEKKESTNNGFFKSGTKDLYTLKTTEGFELDLTKDHKVLTNNRGWVEAQELTVGDSIVVHDHSNIFWEGFGNHNEGWLVGSLLGDGTFDKHGSLLEYCGEEAEYLPEIAISMINTESLNTYKSIKGGEQYPSKISKVRKKRLSSTGLKNLANKVGINSSKNIGDEIYYTSSEFVRGFLSGWFDADGSIQGNLIKDASIRLSSSKLNNLKIAQRLLNNLGIYSKIYQNRQLDGRRLLPDSNGNYKEYWCEATHELVIANENILKFSNIIGFYNQEKGLKLNNIISNYKRTPNKTKRIARFESLTFKHTSDVYDCTIPEIHAFDANGLYVHNCEIGMIPALNGESGWQSCNLTEINGKYCSSRENFLQACEASAIIGTLQAGYTNLKYLNEISKKIFENEALLGCSITGWMDNPDILFDPEIQKEGALKILEVNEKVANMIGINPCARATCVKPAGSTSCVLGTASGIHPHHAKKYIRRVQVNKSEFCGKKFKEKNPLAVEESVWSANKTDEVISFLCEVPQGAIVKNQISAIDLLEKVKLTQQNWVEYGTRIENCVHPKLRHNVSNTITVKDTEWEEVEKFIFDNQKWFAGISLLPASGDLDYTQAPFSTVLTPNELVKEYGNASVFASGLIVDGLHAFNNDLWKACDTVMGLSSSLERIEEPKYPDTRNYKDLSKFFEEKEKWENYYLQTDWIRRVNQFSERYFDSNLRKATYCLKHVSLWKTWCDLKREYVDIDWTTIIEESGSYQNADEQAAAACSGGACEVKW
jgi:intein/homing endonuclease